jgi:hypothetical protein
MDSHVEVEQLARGGVDDSFGDVGRPVGDALQLVGDSTKPAGQVHQDRCGLYAPMPSLSPSLRYNSLE